MSQTEKSTILSGCEHDSSVVAVINRNFTGAGLRMEGREASHSGDETGNGNPKRFASLIDGAIPRMTLHTVTIST